NVTGRVLSCPLHPPTAHSAITCFLAPSPGRSLCAWCGQGDSTPQFATDNQGGIAAVLATAVPTRASSHSSQWAAPSWRTVARSAELSACTGAPTTPTV